MSEPASRLSLRLGRCFMACWPSGRAVSRLRAFCPVGARSGIGVLVSGADSCLFRVELDMSDTGACSIRCCGTLVLASDVAAGMSFREGVAFVLLRDAVLLAVDIQELRVLWRQNLSTTPMRAYNIQAVGVDKLQVELYNEATYGSVLSVFRWSRSFLERRSTEDVFGGYFGGGVELDDTSALWHNCNGLYIMRCAAFEWARHLRGPLCVNSVAVHRGLVFVAEDDRGGVAIFRARNIMSGPYLERIGEVPREIGGCARNGWVRLCADDSVLCMRHGTTVHVTRVNPSTLGVQLLCVVEGAHGAFLQSLGGVLWSWNTLHGGISAVQLKATGDVIGGLGSGTVVSGLHPLPASALESAMVWF